MYRSANFRFLAVTAALLLTLSCGKKDDNNTTPNNGTTANNTTNNGTTTDDMGGTPDMTTADTGGGDMGTDMGLITGEFVAVVNGPLFSMDLVEMKMTHDNIAMGAEDAALALGDYGHKPMLGTTLLGTTENEFLAVDRWDNLNGPMALYSDPDFQAAFGALFSAQPTVVIYEARPDWHGWGDYNIADATDPHFFVVVRGRLANADTAMNQANHDAIAAAGEDQVKAAGDLAHLVYLQADDAQEFLAFDIWADSTNLEAVYTDPSFQAAFGTLFESPPTIGVYSSTDWHAW